MLAILGQFAPALLSALFTALAGLVSSLLNSQRDQALGAQTEAASVDVATVQTTQAVAQAEADAPKTLDSILAQLKAGTA